MTKTYRFIRQPWLTLIVATIFVMATLQSLTLSYPALAAPPWQGDDIAVISEPANNAVVGGVVPIIGSSDHPAFQFYVIEYAPEPTAGGQWQAIGDQGRVSVINGQLAVWDTSTVPDGSYTLRLRTVRQDGNYTEFFAQQIVVSNSQPTATSTPEGPINTPTPALQIVIPTETSTPLPPTPTIIIEQPIVDTPTPRPVATSPPLEDPDENTTFVPTVQGFSVVPLRDACLYGGLLMLSVFVFFGFLSALRVFFKDLRERQGRKK